MAGRGQQPSPADLGSKVASLQARIAKERKILEGFQAMRAATTNADVIRTCESKIREAGRTIGWFEQSLAELQGRPSLAANASDSNYGHNHPSPSSSMTSFASSHSVGGGSLPPGARPPSSATSYYSGSSGYRPPPVEDGNAPAPARSKPNYTNLDLIKADTPLNSAKISRMLHQLEFKLHVERQYKEGIDKMAKLYLVDGDKKARADTENKRIESSQKMVLLNQALKKYKTLDVTGDLGEEDDGIPEDVKTNLRKPLSGALQITIKSARDLAHAPQPKKSKHPSETVIYVKVEDTPRARTHPSRTDRWNEDFEIHVDKANEVEVTIYDKGSSGESAPIPIGMLWLRLSDIVEELRRRRTGAETGPGWVTAARVKGQDGAGGSGGAVSAASSFGSGMMDLPLGAGPGGRTGELGSGPPGTGASDGLDAWFAVEPEGAVALHLNFVKTNVRKRPYDAQGLGRQGAVRKRKEDVVEQNGHKFFAKQFYTVVLCALCGEFLLKGAGMQCEDCKYACHKNCFPKVVTKCISKSNADTDKEEDQINHRIPHRFEPITNISPNWCAHCGLVLPLGRKNARKCSECNITAHADCVHLVPDFCGMSMEVANKLLADIKSINSARRPVVAGSAASGRPAPRVSSATDQSQPTYDNYAQDGPYGGTSVSPAATERYSEIASGVGRLQLNSPHTGIDSRVSSQQPSQGQTQRFDSRQPEQRPAQDNAASAPPPRNSVSTISSFGNDRDSNGSLIASYVDDRSQPARNPPPQQQQYDDRLQQPYHHSQQGPPYLPHPQMSQPMQKPAMQSPYPSSHGSYTQQYTLPPPQQPQHQAYQTSLPHPSQQPQLQLRPSAPPTSLSHPSTAGSAPDFPRQQQLAYAQQSQQRVPQPQQQQHAMVPRPIAQQPAQPQQQIKQQRRIGLDDFNFLAVLGKGNFGKVMLAEEKRSSQLYAIKVLKKEFIIENDEVESTKSEKRVFLAAARERHPFLLGLHSCFQTETRIYFVMEYVSGGDLMLHIQREQFTPRRAKFYAAEVLLALEYFHKNGIVYRDLKLDNILLTLDGHVKVADYGLCKEDMWYGKTTSTFCGTPEFMAPEIILEQRYGRAVDWWAFGVLIYEMLLGQSPFRGEDEDEIFDAILEDEPLYPIHMPRDSVSILQKLLERDPQRRLGAGESDAVEIKQHMFFKDTNWDDVFNKRIPSPFFPSIASATDTSNFDSEFTNEQPTLTPVHSTLSAQDQSEFSGFSWVAPWANDP